MWNVALALGLVKDIPAIVKAATQLVDKIKDYRKDSKARGEAAAGIQALATAVEEIDGRVGTLEETTESQAALIVQLAMHNATLVRWIIILAVWGTISSGIAIAALLLSVVR